MRVCCIAHIVRKRDLVVVKKSLKPRGSVPSGGGYSSACSLFLWDNTLFSFNSYFCHCPLQLLSVDIFTCILLLLDSIIFLRHANNSRLLPSFASLSVGPPSFLMCPSHLSPFSPAKSTQINLILLCTVAFSGCWEIQ